MNLKTYTYDYPRSAVSPYCLIFDLRQWVFLFC